MNSIPKNAQKPVVLSVDEVKQRMEIEQERIRREAEYRRKVYDTICELIDPVTEETLLTKVILFFGNF